MLLPGSFSSLRCHGASFPACVIYTGPPCSALAGDQFAIFESVVALAMLVRRFDFEFAPDAPPVGMTTGATIHTTNGLWLTIKQRPDLEEVRRREAESGQHAQHAGAAGGDGGAFGCPHAAAAEEAAALGCPHAAAAAAAGAAAAQRDVKEVALAFSDAPADKA